MVIVNVILTKFTEQIGPYINKLLKKKKLAEKTSADAPVNDVVKQLKILIPFEVCFRLQLYYLCIRFYCFKGNLWRLSHYI